MVEQRRGGKLEMVKICWYYYNFSQDRAHVFGEKSLLFANLNKHFLLCLCLSSWYTSLCLKSQEIHDFNKSVPWEKISCYFPHYHGTGRLHRNNFSLFNSLKITFSKGHMIGIWVHQKSWHQQWWPGHWSGRSVSAAQWWGWGGGRPCLIVVLVLNRSIIFRAAWEKGKLKIITEVR